MVSDLNTPSILPPIKQSVGTLFAPDDEEDDEFGSSSSDQKIEDEAEIILEFKEDDFGSSSDDEAV